MTKNSKLRRDSSLCSRPACLVALLAIYRSPNFWLKWHRIVFAAMIANDFITVRSVRTLARLFRTAFRTPLRRHHVPLIKVILFLFGKNKHFFALNTRNFNFGHDYSSNLGSFLTVSLSQQIKPFEIGLSGVTSQHRSPSDRAHEKRQFARGFGDYSRLQAPILHGPRKCFWPTA